MSTEYREGQDELPLDRCPHCNVTRPRISILWTHSTGSYNKHNVRSWSTYWCQTCGGVLLTETLNSMAIINRIWPEPVAVSDTIPERARHYLNQAIASVHAPAGAVVLAASAVDSMLKDKGYKDPKESLFVRIDKAAADHLITTEMAKWAHEVRLDANDQRHAEENAPLPNEVDASRVIEFAQALGEFLYVLPAMVRHGRASKSAQSGNPASGTQGGKKTSAPKPPTSLV